MHGRCSRYVRVSFCDAKSLTITDVQALITCLAELDNMKPILTACESPGHYFSGVLQEMACDSEPPSSPPCAPGYLAPCLRMSCLQLIHVHVWAMRQVFNEACRTLW